MSQTVLDDHLLRDLLTSMPPLCAGWPRIQISPAHEPDGTLGAEAVAASEHLSAPLCVWAGDDGPRIRSAMSHLGCDYRSISR